MRVVLGGRQALRKKLLDLALGVISPIVRRHAVATVLYPQPVCYK